jgi:hypothetical protein
MSATSAARSTSRSRPSASSGQDLTRRRAHPVSGDLIELLGWGIRCAPTPAARPRRPAGRGDAADPFRPSRLLCVGGRGGRSLTRYALYVTETACDHLTWPGLGLCSSGALAARSSSLASTSIYLGSSASIGPGGQSSSGVYPTPRRRRHLARRTFHGAVEAVKTAAWSSHDPDGRQPPIPAAARFAISSGGTSSTWVATNHLCPNGSTN